MMVEVHPLLWVHKGEVWLCEGGGVGRAWRSYEEVKGEASGEGRG